MQGKWDLAFVRTIPENILGNEPTMWISHSQANQEPHILSSCNFLLLRFHPWDVVLRNSKLSTTGDSCVPENALPALSNGHTGPAWQSWLSLGANRVIKYYSWHWRAVLTKHKAHDKRFDTKISLELGTPLEHFIYEITLTTILITHDIFLKTKLHSRGNQNHFWVLLTNPRIALDTKKEIWNRFVQ